jgi:hypothetical protein
VKDLEAPFSGSELQCEKVVSELLGMAILIKPLWGYLMPPAMRVVMTDLFTGQASLPA